MESYKEYLVVYIDFLGFRNFIDQKSSEEIEKIIPFLDQIKNCNQDFEVSTEGPVGRIQPSIFFFSDSIVLSFPSDSLLLIPQLGMTVAIQKFIISIAVRALEFGLLIRGAITVGKFYHRQGVIFGEALNKAHRLETESAIFPRIIIDDVVIKRDLIGSSLEEKPPLCRQAWINDLDNIKYLNYLSIYGFSATFEGLTKEYINEWTQNSFNMINQNIQDFEKRGNIKLLQKWNWFGRYFVSSIISLQENYPVNLYTELLEKLYDWKTRKKTY